MFNATHWAAAVNMMLMIIDGGNGNMWRTHLDDDFSASVQLAQLVGDGPVVSVAGGLVLVLEIIERSVYAAYLAVRPPLHAVSAAQALERSHRYMHRLVARAPQMNNQGRPGGGRGEGSA